MEVQRLTPGVMKAGHLRDRRETGARQKRDGRVAICTNAPLVLLEHLKKHNDQVGVAAPVTPTMSKWWSTAGAFCSARRRRADDCGAPFAPAPSGGPAKRRGQTPAQQPEGRGATRSRPLPASMASGVDRIAAPWGRPKAVLPSSRLPLPLEFRGVQKHQGCIGAYDRLALAFL
jgi:hypothetical protein